MAAFVIPSATTSLSTFAALLFLSAQAVAETPPLPPTAPRPTLSPGEPAEAASGLHQPPLPEPRPEPEPSAKTEAAPDAPRPPLPVPRPAPELPPTSGAPGEARSDTPPVPIEELACRSRLRTLGVEFSEQAPIADPAGCAIAHPLVVRSLGRSIKLEPEATLNCATAEAAAGFSADVIAPAAKSTFGLNLVAVGHGSAYVCRPRNGTTKLSEHAFGNAIDIGSFALAGGRSIAVAAATDPREADFLSRIRMTACGPFKTVLGPGTDADHAQHFHFDLAQRRNGGTYCR